METTGMIWGRRNPWLLYIAIGLPLVLILAAIATPNLLRSRIAADEASRLGRQRSFVATEGVAKEVTLAEAVIGSGTVHAASLDRKVIRKGALDLIVENPTSALDQISGLARQHGGYIVSSELTGRQDSQRGNIVMRVPAAQFDNIREELKKLGKHVESEQTSADDVTMQFAENEATLRNFRAEEASYLDIMKRSGAIKDTLQVAQQLSDVRGRIERLEADLRTMSLQVEMTAIQVSVSAEPIAVAGQHWRPLYELRAAWNSGVDALASYATAMMAILLYLPAVLAWLLTIAVGAKLCWMLLRIGLSVFRTVKPQSPASITS